MIKPVPITRARPGMWFHRLGGSGFHHAFVKNGFLLEARDIEVLAEGGVEELIIDTDKGLDVEADEAAVEATPAAAAPAIADAPTAATGAEEAEALPEAIPEPPVEAVAATPPAAPLSPRHSMDQELHRARRICQDSKAQVVALFNDARLGRAIQPEAVMPMVEEINDAVSWHPDALLSVVRLKNHDEYTYMHSVAVCALMVALARRLGLPEEQVRGRRRWRARRRSVRR